jgi:hypothetical protein
VKVSVPSLSGLALGPVSDQSPRRRSLFTGGADFELILRPPDEPGLESAVAVSSCGENQLSLEIGVDFGLFYVDVEEIEVICRVAD